MTSEEINKLKELKQLLDAGILTQEEVQVEKAKILGNGTEEAAAAESEAPEVVQETTPKTFPDSVPEKQNPEQAGKMEGTVGQNGTAKENGGYTIWIAGGIVLFVILLLIMVISSNHSNSSSDYSGYLYPDSEEVPVDSICVEDNDVAEYETDGSTATDDDEFAYDPWVGTVLLKGGVYRRCDTCVSLSLRKTAKGMYEGSLQVMLGYEMDETKFDPSFGMLTGTVRAKADGDVLTVVLDSYTTKAGDSGDDFTSLSLNGQVLRITNNGGSYTATAVGDMEHCFDGGDIHVSK